MLESYVPNQANYEKISLEEQKRRGILGRLRGVIADFKNPTRNGRLYSEDVWEQVFADPIMQEQIESRCVLGEFGHPTERVEIEPEKIALCLAEVPRKGADGKLYGVFDILDTPNGRILKTLCDYGCKIGISSRGSGDVDKTYDGGETVLPGTYDCKCWDAVLLPAVKEARLEYVTEALSTTKNNKTLKESLQQTINEESDKDKRKTMLNCLEENGIDIEMEDEGEELIQEPEGEILTEETPEEDKDKFICDNCGKVVPEEEVISVDQGVTPVGIEGEIFCQECGTKYCIKESKESSTPAVDNNEAVVNELKEALKAKTVAESKLMEAQEKLSVSYAKEAKLQEQIDSLKQSNLILVERAKKAKSLESQVSSLKESVDKLGDEVTLKNERLSKLEEALQKSKEKQVLLKENISSKEGSVATLTEQVNTMNAKNVKLQEQLAGYKKNLAMKQEEYSKKVEKSNKLVEHYKGIANKAINRYIDNQALRFGISSNEIKNKLPESYGFDDIDRICEDLQVYKLNISKLPFSTITEDIKMKVKPSKTDEAILPAKNFDDDIDSQLMGLAGL